jgi:Protein kinase domain
VPPPDSVNANGSLIGQTLDSRYQVEARIGRGGMGDVYLARHLLLGSKVALKVLASERADDPNAARRFVREARSAFRVDHPHCVRVIDLGSSGTALYIAMEYLDGRTVAEELAADGPIASARAAHIGAQVAAALAHAHGLGLVHRDLKPENIMLLRRGADPDFVKVLDFGLARIFDERAELAGTAISLAPLTRDGLVFGTPEYMSPEQARGGQVGPESDVYALGAVLYHMVTGTVPFVGQTFTEILSRHVREPPVPPSVRCPQLDIAHALDQLILACLDKAPERRPPGAHVVGAQLSALAASLPPAAARVSHETAASETADLQTGMVKQAAEAHTAETLELASSVSTALPTVNTTGLEAAIRSGPRRRLFLAAAGAVAIIIVAFAAVWSGARSNPTPSAGGEPSPTPTVAGPAAGAASAKRAAPAAPAADARQEPGEVPAATAGAEGEPESASASERDPDDPEATNPDAAEAKGAGASRRSANQLRAEKHVRRAEAARKAGKFLLQLAEADEARRLDPKNRRAAILMGEALVKSGDRARGCPLLRRSARLYRQAGCAD